MGTDLSLDYILSVICDTSLRCVSASGSVMLSLDASQTLRPTAGDHSLADATLPLVSRAIANRRCCTEAQEDRLVLAAPLYCQTPPRHCLLLERAATKPFTPAEMRMIADIRAVAGAAIEAVSDLRTVFEEASEGIFVTTLAGDFIDVNRGACDLTGRSIDELLQSNYCELFGRSEFEARPVRYEPLLAGETILVQRSLPRRDGPALVVELSGRRISGDRLLAVARDVTARNAAERALRESEARFRALTESAFEGVVLHEDCRIIEVNRRFARMHGYTPAELIGTPVDALLAPEWRGTGVLADSGATPHEVVCVRKDGSRFHAEICSRDVPYGGRVVQLCAGRDITPRKEAEQQLGRIAAERQSITSKAIAAQEQERIALARELHDGVGQMLAVLKMEADWLGRHAEQTDRVQDVSRRILDKANEMLAAVDGLAHSLHPSVLDELGVDRALRNLLAEIARHSDIACSSSIDVTEDLPNDVATALYRIAQEALANVVRHGRASRCTVELLDEDGEVRLCIEHDGVDVAADALDSNATLGIASMHERAQLLGGIFSLVPRPGGGTTLTTRIKYSR